MRTIHKYEFGMSDISVTMGRRFDAAVDNIYLFLKNKISLSEVVLDAISELKGMFNRSIRKDQWNWFTVYNRLGCPPKNEMDSIVYQLVKLRKSIKEDDFEQSMSIRKDLVNSTLPTYLNQWKNRTKVPNAQVKNGWLYVLSRKDEPDILKIGMTTRSVEERVKEINSHTGVLKPFSARTVYKVDNAEEAEKLVHKLLSEYRIRYDREFFQIPFKKAVEMIEKVLSPHLRRTQGQVEWFDENKGYGFIISEEHDHRNIFIHKSQIMDEICSLKPGQKVKFDIRQTDKGLSAENVVPIKE